MNDPRRYPLAGYLSALPEFADRHPETLLPLADRIIGYLTELEAPEIGELRRYRDRRQLTPTDYAKRYPDDD